MPAQILDWLEQFSSASGNSVDGDVACYLHKVHAIAEYKGYVNELDCRWCEFIIWIKQHYPHLLTTAILAALNDLDRRLRETSEALDIMGQAPFLVEQKKEYEAYIAAIKQFERECD